MSEPDGRATGIRAVRPAADELVAGDVVLRRPPEAPSEALIDAVLRIHSDPETYRHVPAAPLTDRDGAAAMIERWLDDWRTTDVGYRLVIGADERLVGMAGVRVLASTSWSSTPLLNLYYRLEPAVWGRGIARAAADAVLVQDASRRPDLPVIARIAPANTPSLRLAERLGFLPTPWQDVDGGTPHRVHLLPPGSR